MTKYIIVHSAWDDDDDLELINHIKSFNKPFKISSKQEILNEDPQNVEMLFCNTSVMQKYITKHNPNYKVIDTYPEYFKNMYHRGIKIMKLNECVREYIKNNKPYFVKPYKNNKCFAGFVINNNNDNFSVYRLASYDNTKINNDISDSMDIYVCDPVKFVNEYRLFIGNNQIYGITESSQYLIDSIKVVSVDPPEEFIKELLAVLQENEPNVFCVIDVGMLDNGQWVIVEANPPFALNNYDFPIDEYYNYCKLAYDSIMTKN